LVRLTVGIIFGVVLAIVVVNQLNRYRAYFAEHLTSGPRRNEVKLDEPSW
jgi:hypothetical protein